MSENPDTAQTEKPKPQWRQRIIETLVFVVIFVGIMSWQSKHLIAPGEEAPDIVLQTLDGGEMNLADLRGKQTMLVFWAPWCGVCGAESDNVSRAMRWMGNRANVVSVATGFKSLADVEQYVEKHQVDYPVMLDDGRIADAYQLRAFPTIYVLDKEGRVKRRVTGYTSTIGMMWRALL